jgi:hypothetical protein
MGQLIPALPDLLVSVQEAVHGPDGTKAGLGPKGRVDLLRGFIYELLRIKDIQDLLTFLRGQGMAGARPPG